MKKLILICLSFICCIVFTSCDEWFVQDKDPLSDMPALYRTLVVYDENGDTIAEYSGKFNLKYGEHDNQVYFDLDGKRIWIQGGIVVCEEM